MLDMENPLNTALPMVPVWDRVVRYGHWTLAAAFTIAYLTEGHPEWLHTWAGYIIAATVVLRLCWGLVGTRHARFSDFVTGPGQVLSYLSDLVMFRAKRYVGHSPAGGAMTLALLVMLGFTAFAGMATLAAQEGRGPLAGYVALAPLAAVAPAPEAGEPQATGEDAEGEERHSDWVGVHEFCANFTLMLILVHLAGVLFASRAHHENLTRAMIDGRKRP
jgi:cytochrome b